MRALRDGGANHAQHIKRRDDGGHAHGKFPYPRHRLVVIRGGDSEHAAINGAPITRASGLWSRHALVPVLRRRENLLGEASEAEKMTIHSPPFANDLEAAHPWIILRLPSLHRAELAIRSRQTPRCSIGCRKSRGSPNRKTFSGATGQKKRTRGCSIRRNGLALSSN